MSSVVAPDGVLLVDKAEGMTSHDVVALLRRQLGIKKIGHCGTLDPIATGLLLLTIGRGTKVQDLLMSEDKEYVGTLTLGASTSTQDREGEVVEIKPVPQLSESEIRAAFEKFRGDFYQLPPMVSAKKHGGVRSTNWPAREKWSSASRASFTFIATRSTGSRCRISISACCAAKVLCSHLCARHRPATWLRRAF